MPENKPHPSFNHFSFFAELVKNNFFVFDENKNLLFFSGKEDFRAREYFRVYSDQSRNQELLSYQKNKEGFWEIKDSVAGKTIGFFKDSIFSGQKIFSEDKQEIGKIPQNMMVLIMEIVLSFFGLDDLARVNNKSLIVSTTYNEKIGEIIEKLTFDTPKCNMTLKPQSFVNKKLVIASGLLFIRNLILEMQM